MSKQTHASTRRPRKRAKQRVRLAVLPRRENQYRPHLARSYVILMMLFLIATLQVGYNYLSTGSVLGSSQPSLTKQELFTQTNDERRDKNLPTLYSSKRLDHAATLKADDMLTHQYWAHTSPSGVEPWHWFDEADYRYSYAGENLARNFSSTDGAIAAWMNSKEHRENILNPHYKDVGFAVKSGTINGKKTQLIVALYGTKRQTIAVKSGLQGGIASAAAPQTDAARSGDVGALTRVGIGLKSLTPAAIVSMVAILVIAAVALIAHLYRAKLPQKRRQTWYRYHGIIKVGAMIVLCVAVVLLYSGGQI